MVFVLQLLARISGIRGHADQVGHLLVIRHCVVLVGEYLVELLKLFEFVGALLLLDSVRERVSRVELLWLTRLVVGVL